MNRTRHPRRWLIILPPLLFLLIFFLVPFFYTLKISFAESVIRIPPFTDIFTRTADHRLHLTLDLNNFRRLFTEELYGLAYLFSLRTAFFSTLICLLLGYPIAYAMSRAPRATQKVLLLAIILPFWTSFLLRVYALEAVIQNDGILNMLLLRLGLISHPLVIMHTNLAIYIGIVYSYLPYMVLPLFATLQKLVERGCETKIFDGYTCIVGRQLKQAVGSSGAKTGGTSRKPPVGTSGPSPKYSLQGVPSKVIAIGSRKA